MKKIKRSKDKKQKNFVLKFIQNTFSASIFKFNVAVAMPFILILLISSFVQAGDVVVQNGQLNVNNYLNVDASGNIGINTTAPASHLEVSGAGNQSIRVTSTDGSRASIYFSRPGADSAGAPFKDWSVENYGGALRFRYSPDDFASLFTKMAIYPNGNIGIGTINPAERLVVVGNANISGTLNVSDRITFANLPNCNSISSDANGVLSCGAGVSGTGLPIGTIGQTLRHDGANWVVDSNIVNDGAKVGIGATIPATKLHVKNTADNSVIVADSGDGTTPARYSAVDFYDNNNPKWGIGKNPSGDFYIDQSGVGGGNVITILKSNRNVAVGSTNPDTTAKLTVAGQIKITGGSPSQGKVLTADDPTGIASWQTPAAVTWTQSGSNIQNANPGNVGVGTAADSVAKLTVAGQVKITGGVPAAGKVLTSSDANGLATWQTPATMTESDPTVKTWAKTDTPTIPGDSVIGGILKISGPYVEFPDGTKQSTATYSSPNFWKLSSSGIDIQNVNSAGGVGIGAVNPYPHKLTVGGNILLSSAGSYIQFPDGSRMDTASGSGFWTSVNTNDIKNINLGGVGIGINPISPNALTVGGTIKLSGTSSGIIFSDLTKQSSAGGQWITVSGTNVQTATPSANVGIGAAPVAGSKLTVNGFLKFSLIGTGLWFYDGSYQTTAANQWKTFANLVDIQNNNAGSVGIGGAPNSAYKLDVFGAVRATSFSPPSDSRFKKNVTELSNVLDKLKNLRGVSFEWNEKYKEIYNGLGKANDERQIGVIAQELEKEFPELVLKSGNESYRAVDYGRFTAVLLEAIKEQQKEINELKEQNKVMGTKINGMMAQKNTVKT